VYPPERCLRLLFVAALLVGQFSLLLHQLDLEHHAEGKACSICLASPGLDHALAAVPLPATVRATAEAPVVLPASFPVARSPVRLVARSPPVSPLHA
jgi:hypothetical protein